MTNSIDGVDRAMSRFRAISHAIHIERHALHIAESTPPVVGDPYRAPGDTRALRGIPAIGRGVQGAIPGTRPDTHG